MTSGLERDPPKQVCSRILQYRPLLDAVSADARMAPASETSTETMAQGSRRYLTDDYKGAFAPCERALELEELKQQLQPDLRRVLVDNLCMSFALSGNLDSAAGVFRFGACARAERKDMTGAIEELRVAFRNQNTMIKGESMPDPAKDDSFAPFLSKADFASFLKELR